MRSRAKLLYLGSVVGSAGVLAAISGCQHDTRPAVVERRVVHEPGPVPEVAPPAPNSPADPLATGTPPPPVDVERGPAPVTENLVPVPNDPRGEARPAPALAVVGGSVQPTAPAPVEPAAQANTTVNVTFQPPPQEVYTTYEQDLSPYGRWVEVENYGRCWMPRDRREGWRPYLDGYWQYSEYGWVWTPTGPEAQWGMIAYHYGRWFPDRTNGWVWAPGSVWSPAWVAWREGHGYAAWAPLPPAVADGTVLTAAVVDRYCPAEWFVGCQTRYLSTPQLLQNLILNNTSVINQTTNITNITYQNGRAINTGVNVAAVEKASGHPIQRVELAEANSIADARKLHQQNKPVMFTPPALSKIAHERIAAHGQDPANAAARDDTGHDNPRRDNPGHNNAAQAGTPDRAAAQPAAAHQTPPRDPNDGERDNRAQPAAGRVPPNNAVNGNNTDNVNRNGTVAEPGAFAPPGVRTPPARATDTPAGDARGQGQVQRNNIGNRGNADEARPAPAPARGASTPPTPPADHIAPTPAANSDAAPQQSSAPANNNAANGPARGAPANNSAGHSNAAPAGGNSAPAQGATGGGGKP